ncbi:MAG TPA: class III extradiol ring-cleavage dioxygenase [Advenella sp.]|nr:class III extradiol ring-cleavage dioxygenase [Advenella sp.]
MMTMPVYFISHGGGPWPWIDEWKPMYAALHDSLQRLPAQLPETPKAVLMVSAHWITDEITVSTAAQPGMLYDYYGFPEHTYSVQYPAPGDPALAARVQALLQTGGIAVTQDAERGFDHGAFVPMAVAFPKANIPMAQLSIRKDYDPAFHLQLGRLLAPLREEGVLIIGSGLSYHNLRLLDERGAQPSAQFDAWLQQTVVNSNPEQRANGLLHWEQAPSARLAHAHEDHLIPLMVAVGAAQQDPATLAYHEAHAFGSITASSFRFSQTPA